MYHFYIEIEAPDGLAELGPHLASLPTDLQTHRSGYNGKVILRWAGDDDVEWNMDSSDTNFLFASGEVTSSLERAEQILTELSTALTSAGFAHRLGIDDENGNLAGTSSFLWSGEHHNS